MDRKHNKNHTDNAKSLRRAMTKEERHLWYDFLRNYPVKIYRQRVIGKYIADFYCAPAKLVIELDGSQHYEDAGLSHDSERTAYLEAFGLTVLRIPNNAVNDNFRDVCEHIDIKIRQTLHSENDER